MALLSGAGTGAPQQRLTKFAKILVRGNTLICLALYTIGLAYFWMLAHNFLTHGTYFSENALLPGLVYSEIKSDSVQYAQRLAAELELERSTGHQKDTPHVWLQAKMRQIGLETYTQNFTLNFPLGGGKVFRGRNVYGILRAPRIGSTESFVLSAPYRAPDSVHPPVAASVPLLLAFAAHARKQKYWSKDLIFLITEQEQLGMQAWLEAYHGTIPHPDTVTAATQVLQSGSLEARAGSIQAAINLELPAFANEFVDTKIEGLNGNLPNLDLVNVVQRIALKEGIVCGHQQRSRRRRNGAKSSQLANFEHMVAMVLRQASGVPNGNHGLFGRYGIAALTLEGHRSVAGAEPLATSAQREADGAAALLKLVEGVSRSVNNLLERFHQSFFFYLLVASDRFVSIGDYMPALAAMCGALLLKALIVWLRLVEPQPRAKEVASAAAAAAEATAEGGQEEEATEATPLSQAAQEAAAERAEAEAYIDPDLDMFGVGRVLLLVHTIGLAAAHLPVQPALNRWGFEAGLRTEQFQLGLQTAIGVGCLAVPWLAGGLRPLARHVLQIAALLELATALLVVGMLNFAFAFTLSVWIVPLVLFVNAPPIEQPEQADKRRAGAGWRSVVPVSRVLCIALHPLVVVYGAVLALTVYSFPELPAGLWASRSLLATAEAITFAVTDSMIYGNWVFNVVLLILLPIWMSLWTVTFASPAVASSDQQPSLPSSSGQAAARQPKQTLSSTSTTVSARKPAQKKTKASRID